MCALTVKDIVRQYSMEPHMEGGYFKEDFRSELMIPGHIVEKHEARAILTTCYYLVPKGERSIFHRLSSDEIWNLLLGGPIDGYEITPHGKLNHIIFGNDLAKGEYLKFLVKKGNWFGVLSRNNVDYSLFSAIVYPGFEYSDWERGDPKNLKRLCPEAENIINLLT